ncbi:MAG: RecQ family ATP-dependent DNA helicase [Chitinophagales bacterium]
MTIEQILKTYWGYDSFRPKQADIINHLLAGKDTLALLPTGGGKSICFQVPGLAREGLCLVISPLIALMKDQVYNLQKRNISAAAIYSGMSSFSIDRLLNNAVYGKLKFLYVSPERLQTKLFQARLPQMNVRFIAIDESHCISQWGYDFRPSYLKIAEVRNILPKVPLIALTATATERVKQDIQDKLAFREGSMVFQQSFTRANLSYSVFEEESKAERVLHILKKVSGSGIVYARSRRRTKTVADYLRRNGIKADFYHAGLNSKQRSAKQEAWIKNKIRIMVCTNAFGMGIDKPDVRVVVHIDLPESLEAYYQEAGRGGRDGKKSYAVLLYNANDHQQLLSNLEKSFPEPTAIKTVYQSLHNYYNIAVGAGREQNFEFDLPAFCKNYDLSIVHTFSILKLLAENGYIHLSDTIFNPSRIFFTVHHEEVYKFQVANRRAEPYLKAILRTYGGAYDDYVAINEKLLAKKTNSSEGYVKNALRFLQQHNILDYQAQSKQPQITFLKERISADRLVLNHQLIAFRQKVQTNNIQAVIDYTNNPEKCRSQQLVSYFGENDSVVCGVCDVCLANKRKNQEGKRVNTISELIHDILSNQESIHLDDLSEKIENYQKEEVVKTIRFLMDQQIVYLNQAQEVGLV